MLSKLVSYTAAGLLVGWVGYVLITPDEATRVSRACMPFGASVKLVGAAVRLVDEPTGEGLMKGAPLATIRSCRNAVWYWAYGNKPTPVFPNSDPLFGNYEPVVAAAPPAPTPAKPAPASAPANVAPPAPVPAPKPAMPVAAPPEQERL